MPTALGPRFVLEAGFLVLLALVVGLADLDPVLIVLVMLVGWILVSLIEYFAWRQSQSAIMRGFEPEYAGVGMSEMAADEAPPPPPPPTPTPPPTPAPQPEEETVVEPPAGEADEPETPAEAEEAQEPAEPEEPQAEEAPAPAAEEPAPAADSEETAFATADESRIAHRLEPLQPRPRRKWIIFGRYQRRDEPAEDDNEA
jgi:type IV secretory pathway VirB10-like protein